MSDKKKFVHNHIKTFINSHGISIIVIFLFIISSYFIISSDYNHVHADAGAFARHAEVLYEKNKIDVRGSASATIGQLLFSNILCHIFGFKLKILHISVYIINFLCLIALYFLFLELGLNRFLSLFGSLTLLVNPISLRLIDWYLTEPFFMFYLVLSLFFYIKALRSDKYRYFYIASGFCTFAILTRQHAISIPVSLLLICVIYRNKFNLTRFLHCFVSLMLPIISIGLFYLYNFSNPSGNIPTGFASANLTIIKNFLDPVFLFSRVYFDSLFFLHYTTLYLAPLFIIIIFSLVLNPRKINEVYSNFRHFMISVLFVSIGTIILYIDKQKMPYRPSIFSIGNLTKIFNFNVINAKIASSLLTIFTWIGAIIILIKLLDHFFPHNVTLNYLPKKNNKKNKNKNKKNLNYHNKPNKLDLGESFFYLWGIIYIFVTIFIGLRYDRYIFPLSVLMIFIVLRHFSWIEKQKKMFLIIFIVFFFVFIYKVAARRFALDLEWEATYSLIHEGVPFHEIRSGLGFNHFKSFYYITNLYKNVKIKRPINWYKFHPLANFFVTGKAGLEKRHLGLVLYKSFSGKRLFGLLQRNCHIYKRKEGHKEAIWI